MYILINNFMSKILILCMVFFLTSKFSYSSNQEPSDYLKLKGSMCFCTLEELKNSYLGNEIKEGAVHVKLRVKYDPSVASFSGLLGSFGVPTNRLPAITTITAFMKETDYNVLIQHYNSNDPLYRELYPDLPNNQKKFYMNPISPVQQFTYQASTESGISSSFQSPSRYIVAPIINPSDVQNVQEELKLN